MVKADDQIFRGLKSLTLSDPLQASLLRLSAKGISVFSPHTSLDAAPNGINTWQVTPAVVGSIPNLQAGGAVPAARFVVEAHRRIHLGHRGRGDGQARPAQEGPSDVGDRANGQAAPVSRARYGSGVEIFGSSLTAVQIATPDEERPIESIAVCAGSGEPRIRAGDIGV